MDGFGMDIEEVTDREDEEESSHLKQSPKQPEPKRMRQVKLDTFLKCSGSMARPSSSTATSPSVVKVHSPRRSKSSFSVTTSIVPVAEVSGLADGKSALQRRSLLVVEEVDRDNLDSSIREQEIKRMSATIQKAKNRYDRTTLDSYVSRKETKFASLSQDESFTIDMEEEPDLEPLRCYSDQYPDLNDKQNTDIVLVSIGSIRPNVIPRPYPPACTDPTLGWNKGRNYVRLPFSTLNLHDDEMQFAKIQQHLLKLTTPLTSVDQIQECIESYIQRNWRFDALKKFFESAIPDELAKEYLSSVIPFIAKLALSAPDLITQPLPILRHGQEGSVTMSQQQAATLLAHAFFCTYPNRNGHSGGELPIINFNRLYDLRTRGSIEKLKCIMHYFHQISVQMPSGVLTYRRQRVSPPPIWREICQPLSEFVVSSSGTIEDDGHGMLQVDFANMFIGGGVLASGCVQEEIRFMICPEMIVSMLICERMRRNESIVIVGAQRYSDYAGYGNSFQWYPLHAPEALSRDRFERLHCELVAIDALPFSQPKHQFTVDLVDRELLKAYCGFRIRDGSSKAIATGNWGCGVFGGDLRLKSMIQLIAASMNARPLCYFTFGNRGFANQLRLIHKELVHMNINTNQLYDLVVLYCLEQSGQSMNLFEFIHQKLNSSV